MMARFIGPLLSCPAQYLGRGDEITALYEIEIADDSQFIYDSDASYTVPHGDVYESYSQPGFSLDLSNEDPESTQLVSISIAGENDAPTILVSDGSSNTVDLSEDNSSLTAEGSFTVEDIDRSDVVTASAVSVVKTGAIAGIVSSDAQLLSMLYLTPTSPRAVLGSDEVVDQLAWAFHSGPDAFDYLADGEILSLSYTVRVADSVGASADTSVTINITGSNDGPLTSVVDVSGSIVESAGEYGVDQVLTDDPGNMVAYNFSSFGGQVWIRSHRNH